jgi:cytidine deaminase
MKIESSSYKVCAEFIAMRAALSNSEKEMLAVVTVANRGNGFIVLSPCSNCCFYGRERRNTNESEKPFTRKLHRT